MAFVENRQIVDSYMIAEEIIQNEELSVLVNGCPTPQFGVEKGLRQGDPLSPFLFNIIVEGLNCLLHKAVNLGLMCGERFGNGARRWTKSFWNPIVSKIENRLTPWKRKFLFKGGRLVLIKSVMASIPTYFFSIFKISASVANKVEKLQRDFLWGDGRNKRKIHFVKGPDVCKNQTNGGLGIGRILDKNKGMLA
ncbi:hypothetical protein Ddye_024469 [Dipteronia dyeriana]|uniref:Reverse transcriptase domain-containing protein n=1 Tax=Dipteronia dyeriana TaxID=168575 RepID=A0AAD9WTM3_9ROSI|nr:hypothetical protein Ddye_024469 [Dipteronia dyeriana]